MSHVVGRRFSRSQVAETAVTAAAPLDRSARSWVAIGVTATVAAALRLPIVGFGLPYLWHPDEPSNVGIGANMVDLRTWNPHAFRYPSMIYDVVAIAGQLQRVFGGWHIDGGQSAE